MRVSPYLSMWSRQIIISPCSGPTQSQQRITMWYTWYCQNRLSSILSKIMLLIWDRNFKLIAQKKNSCIFSPKSASWRSTNPHFPPESSITRSTEQSGNSVLSLIESHFIHWQRPQALILPQISAAVHLFSTPQQSEDPLRTTPRFFKRCNHLSKAPTLQAQPAVHTCNNDESAMMLAEF